MKKQLLSLIGLLLILGQAFAETTPPVRPSASQLAVASRTYTTIASSVNPSTVGTSVTFTSTTTYLDINSFTYVPITTEGTVTFSEGATVLAADVPVVAGLASFSTTALTAGSHDIRAVYNGTANYATSTGSIAQSVDDPGSCPTYAGNIAYVNGSATPGTNDGTTWARAFLTLQGALDAARTCGVTQIWVAQGTYVPTNYPVGAASGQFAGVLTSADFSFHLVNGVAMYGGFSGGETQLSQRNWRQNPTILSGSNARNHVVLSANDGLSTRLDGFTITGGYAIGNANGTRSITVEGVNLSQASGGGVIMQSSSLTLSNLLISGNSSSGPAGGMQMQGGASVLTNVAFVGNSANGAGGLNASGTSFTLTNGVFSGNTAQGFSGGMFVSSSSPTLTNVVFANNTATSDGGALVNNGRVTTLINCTFFGNSAAGKGGAMFNVNGAKVQDLNGIYYGNSAPTSPDVHNNRNDEFSQDTFTPTTALFGTDPKFVSSADPDGPDNQWMTADDGLALQSTSPAINAGTLAGAPGTDIRGFARTGNPDQGAYEYVVPGPTASVLNVNGLSTICRGTSTNLIVTITGGTSPYTVVYSDGTDSYTVNGYTSGADIPVSPTVNTSYSLVSVTDAASIAGTGNSGTPAITVTEPPMWYLDADGDTHYLSSVASCTSPGDGYTTTGGTLGDCDDKNKDVWQLASLYIDGDGDGYDAGRKEVCYGAPLPSGYKTTTLGTDCDDTNKDVWQSASLYIDGDDDGYDAGQKTVCYGAAIPVGYKTTTLGTDCNDSEPGTLEVSLGAACRQVYAGYDATSNRTVLTATATGQGGSGYTYLWSNNATSPSITVSPATTTIYSVTVSKAGCSATGSVTVNVINVACEKNKVLICHNGLTLCVSKTGKNGVADHLAHGDKLGSCNTVLPCGSTGGRLAAYEPEAALSISLQANPIENGELRAIVRGVGGQPLTVQLHDVRGYVIRQQSWQQAEADQRIEWNLSTQSTGLYLLRAVSNSQQQTVKVLKP